MLYFLTLNILNEPSECLIDFNDDIVERKFVSSITLLTRSGRKSYHQMNKCSAIWLLCIFPALGTGCNLCTLSSGCMFVCLFVCFLGDHPLSKLLNKNNTSLTSTDNPTYFENIIRYVRKAKNLGNVT